MRILVIQLERLGDLVQLTPALRELRVLAPSQLVLWAIAEFTPVLEGFEGLHLRTSPGDLVARLNHEVQHCWENRKEPSLAAQTLHDMDLGAFDAVLNLTHGAFAAWAAPQIQAPLLLGRYLNPAREWLYEGAWLQLLPSIVDLRELHAFNLVDTYRGAARELIARLHPAHPLLPLPSANTHPYATHPPSLPQALPEAIQHPPRPLIALNPGASAPERQWPAASFATLADRLSVRGFLPVLVGAPSDAALGEAIVAQCQFPPVNLCGKTTIASFAAVLKRASLLISNDTAAVHIGAAMGTPVLGLYGAAASFRETAPWGEGHVILQLPLGSPMNQIPPAVVELAAAACLHQASWDLFTQACQNTPLSAWKTFFLAPKADPLGGLAYAPLHPSPDSPRDLLHLCLRHAFASELSGPKPLGCEGDFGPRRFQEDPLAKAALVTELQHLQLQVAHLQTLSETCINALAQNQPLARSSLSAHVAHLESHLQTLPPLLTLPSAGAPVISYLLWHLRFLPRTSPETIFQAYRDAFARTLRILAKTLALFEKTPTTAFLQRLPAPPLHPTQETCPPAKGG